MASLLAIAGAESGSAQSLPKKAEKRDDGKEVDPCRQSGAVAARLANYRLLGKPLAALIADVRESGVEEAPTPKVEQIANEVYALGLLPAEAFERYRAARPFRD